MLQESHNLVGVLKPDGPDVNRGGSAVRSPEGEKEEEEVRKRIHGDWEGEWMNVTCKDGFDGLFKEEPSVPRSFALDVRARQSDQKWPSEPGRCK